MLMPFGTALYRRQYRSSADQPAHHLSGHRAFTVFMGPLGGQGQRQFRQVSDLLLRQPSRHRNGGRLDQYRLGAFASLRDRRSMFLMFVGIFSRMIPSQALLSAVPEVTKRGAFNAINASLQQFAGGISAAIAGAVINPGA